MEENQGSASPEQEKMLPQSEVNKIVAREKAAAAERASREAELKYQRDLESLNALRQQQEQRNAEVPRDNDVNAMYQRLQERFNQDQARREEELKKKQYEEHINQVAQTYSQKHALGKDAYTDFEEVMKDYDPGAFPQITYLLAGMDNMVDVEYELAKNPQKLAELYVLANQSPKLAQRQLLKLSQSIGANKQAQADAQTQKVPDPLDRLNPSRVSGNNGKMGIRDLRNQPWLKG